MKITTINQQAMESLKPGDKVEFRPGGAQMSIIYAGWESFAGTRRSGIVVEYNTQNTVIEQSDGSRHEGNTEKAIFAFAEETLPWHLFEVKPK